MASLPETPLRLKGMASRRRAAWLGVFGAFAIVAILHVVRVWILNLPPIDNPLGVLAVLVFMFGLRVLLLPLMKWDAEISQRGVRNVGLLRQGKWITWDDFREQRVQEGLGIWAYQLLDVDGVPIRKGWFRIADVKGDLDEWLHELIRTIWVRPDLPDAPPVLFTSMNLVSEPAHIVLASEHGVTLIKYGPDVKATLKDLERNRFDQQGIRRMLESLESAIARDNDSELDYLHRQTTFEMSENLREFFEIEQRHCESRLPWDAVESIDLWQAEHGRRDFAQLSMRLADCEVMWRGYGPTQQGSRNFQGADASELMAMIREHVPVDRIITTAYEGQPRSLAEWERRVERIIQPKRKDVRLAKYLFLGGTLLMSLGCFVGAWKECVPQSIMLEPILFGFWYIARRDLQEVERQYDVWRQHLGPEAE
ncbi:MAG: hypothetical protein KDA93_24090 [Planctomycetaceae bacterium]|nr:hypothetical protein [Planctomycetaceae bacterium]